MSKRCIGGNKSFFSSNIGEKVKKLAGESSGAMRNACMTPEKRGGLERMRFRLQHSSENFRVSKR